MTKNDVQKSVEGIKDTVLQTEEELLTNLQNAIKDAEKILGEAKTAGEDKAVELRAKARETLSAAYGSLGGAKENILDHSKELVDHGKEWAEDQYRQGKRAARKLYAQGQEYADEMYDSAVEFKDDILERGHHFAEEADDYVHQNPWTTIGIASVAALLLGVIIGRR